MPKRDPEERATFSVWLRESERDPEFDFLDEFDEAVVQSSEKTRNEHVLDAMKLYMAVQDAYETAGFEPGGFRGKRAHVRQAILDQIRRERGDDT